MTDSASPSPSLQQGYRLAGWTVRPAFGELGQGDDVVRLEPKVMGVLQVLANHAGEVVSKQQLVDAVWAGRPVTDEVIARCISALRHHLDDDHKAPRYIETLPKRGYRLIPVPVPLAPDEPAAAVPARGRVIAMLAVAAMLLAGLYALLRDEPPSATAIASIAVLPFTNMSRPDDQYLADGVTEELTFALTQLPDLQVAARTSAFRFRDTTLDIREIGRQMDVDSVIEGSVRRAGDDLRVTAQLIDARSGFHLWAATFDGNVADIFRLQRQVAERVRDSIGLAAAAEVSEPSNFAAYDLYLRGRYALNRRGADSLAHAVDLFREAIERDPAYGPAYLELANTLLLMPSYTDEPADAMFDAALDTIGRGVAADATISNDAAAVHGYIHNKRGEWLQADEAYRRALASGRASSSTHQWYSNMLASVGRLGDAQQEAQHARQLDPLSPVVTSRLAMTSLWANDHETAARQFQVARELGMRSALHVESNLLLLIREGRHDEARALSAVLGEGSSPDWFVQLLDCLAEAGACAAAADALRLADVPSRVELVAWALLDRVDEVARVARQLQTDITTFETELLFIDELAAYRQTPAFFQLLDAIGITAYWQASGCAWTTGGLRCPRDG